MVKNKKKKRKKKERLQKVISTVTQTYMKTLQGQHRNIRDLGVIHNVALWRDKVRDTDLFYCHLLCFQPFTGPTASFPLTAHALSTQALVFPVASEGSSSVCWTRAEPTTTMSASQACPASLSWSFTSVKLPRNIPYMCSLGESFEPSAVTPFICLVYMRKQTTMNDRRLVTFSTPDRLTWRQQRALKCCCGI